MLGMAIRKWWVRSTAPSAWKDPVRFVDGSATLFHKPHNNSELHSAPRNCARLFHLPQIDLLTSAWRASCAHGTTGPPLLATEKELATFLAEVERRAFKQAVFAVRDEQLALDLVQDAMLKLAEKYAAKPSAELPLLFQRILQNTIRDHYRRQRVRSLWTTLLSSLHSKQDEDDHDPLDTVEVNEGPGVMPGQAQVLERCEVVQLIEDG